jgi:hypothetical protein
MVYPETDFRSIQPHKDAYNWYMFAVLGSILDFTVPEIRPSILNSGRSLVRPAPV